MEYRNGPSKGTAGIRGKDDERKLFVGGLPKTCEEKDLKEAFSKFGTIESINIKKDPVTGASRGFCFIVFSEASVVDEILSSENSISINGKTVDPRKVTKTTTPGKIFIGGLTPDFTEDKIREYFSQHGTIKEVEWPFDRQKNQRRPYCFLTFENRDTVTELLKTPKVQVCGKELDVKKVKFNPDMAMQHAGMYGARGGRGAYIPYGPAYAPYGGYGYDYPSEYTGYEDYYKGYESYYETYDYEGYPPAYAPRAPRGGRAAGGYTRHTPY